MIGPYIAMAGLLLSMPLLLNIGIILFGGAVLFYVITLPVEFNASARAIAILRANNVLTKDELNGVKKDAGPEDIAASFQKTAVEILLRALLNAVHDSGLTSIAAGGGVAANSYLRSRLAEQKELHCVFPPPEFCGDNGAMIAGIAFHYLSRGDRSPLSITASARVEGFKKKYP
jgi:tRNA A37 threonylcarbamoyltransferase TsaD